MRNFIVGVYFCCVSLIVYFAIAMELKEYAKYFIPGGGILIMTMLIGFYLAATRESK